jgi:hypothetical protein
MIGKVREPVEFSVNALTIPNFSISRYLQQMAGSSNATDME